MSPVAILRDWLPTDIFFKVAVWYAIVRLLGLTPHEQGIAFRIYAGPAIGATVIWFLLMFHAVAPVARWERGAAGDEALIAANQAARRAPMFVALITTGCWLFTILPPALVLVYATPEVHLPQGTLAALLLAQAAMLMGGAVIGFLHMMHGLGPVNGRISIALRLRALRVPPDRASMWRRNLMVALALAIAPAAFVMSLSVMHAARDAEAITALRTAAGLPAPSPLTALIDLFQRAGIVIVGVALFAVIAAAYLSKNMLAVVERVAAALREIADSGKVAGGGRIPLLSRGELGVLVDSANAMIDRLEEAQAESAAAAASLREANALLEERVAERTESLQDANRRLEEHVDRLRLARSQLADAARKAGMAEVASSVLHNVGNVLNSVNVSTALLAERLRGSKLPLLDKTLALVPEGDDAAAAFLAGDARGKLVPTYLRRVSAALAEEHAEMRRELSFLEKNIEHIKIIVSLQQAHAKQGGLLEPLRPAELCDDAVRFSFGVDLPEGLKLERDLDTSLEVVSDRHRLFQIFVNLLRNARDAVAGKGLLRLTVRADGDWVLVQVSDDGCGVAPEHLTRIFNLGFTTKTNGHGYGLHSSANAARELGGDLSVRSDGPGRGATFTLRLPRAAPASATPTDPVAAAS